MMNTLKSLVERLRSDAYDPWAILFELLLIGICVNWCAGVLQGTRGTRLLRGLLVVLVVVTLMLRLVSGQQDYTRLELLSRYFIIGLAFIALVAFQPELRRAFIRAGEVTFLRRGSPAAALIAALVESAKYLSRNKYGALIAIQRDVGLRNWAENGTLLNAEVSASLLNTLFFPNTALHDLGVIIEGNRILAAGCQFPQAESGELDASLGSRHRAAVGLSQESDALVLVVSEETGAISLADRGKLIRFLSLSDLEEELQSRLGRRFAETTKLIKRHSWSDIWRFCRRLLVITPLTLVIWFLADQASLIRIDNIDIQIAVASDAGLKVDVLNPNPPVFTVSFEGPTREVDRLRAEARAGALVLDYPLPSVFSRPGGYELDAARVIDLHPEITRRGLSVTSVAPATLDVRVDELVTLKMPVQLDAGRVQISSDARIEPREVRVTMRRGDLEQIPPDRHFVVARVEDLLARVPPDQTLSLADVILDNQVHRLPIVSLDPTTVDVTARVLGEQVTVRRSGVVVFLRASVEFLQRYNVVVADRNEWRVDIELRGDKDRLESLTAQRIDAFVNLTIEQASVATGGTIVAEVQFQLPEGVELVGPPPQLQVRITPREE